MTNKIFIDRSRYEQAQRCQRSRYLQYHRGGTGIDSARKPLPLAVGSSVHEGLAELLRYGQMLIDSPASSTWELVEEKAVTVALSDFAEYQNAIDLPDAEQGALTPQQARSEDVIDDIDEYLFQEQSALVEAMVRAYARRRLRPLLDQFEVLEVEREGEWELSTYQRNQIEHDGALHTMTMENIEIWFMSRPDALLRERSTNQLFLLSYKTTGSWDVRKARDAEHDMQGMSEGIEIERRLNKWWDYRDTEPGTGAATALAEWGCSDAMLRYLASCDAPPRILAVRMEYMLKGERWKDKELSERFGVEMRSQKSPLIRQYVAHSTPQKGTAGFKIGDVCWSWDYIREDGRDSNLAWQNWKSRPIFDEGQIKTKGAIKQWIDQLDDAAPAMSGEDSTMGMAPRLLGYHCDAQAVGVTREHPLDSVFIPPMIVYRNDDDLRDMVDQMESQERRIAEGVEAVAAAQDADDVRHALNVHFPQTRRACSYPTECQFTKICYGGEDIRSRPLDSGLYRIRVANHPQESQS